MEPKEIKTALEFYGSAYSRASFVFGVVGILTVLLVAGLMLTDPLHLRNVGVYTNTDYDFLYDCKNSWDSVSKSCVLKMVPVGTEVYGYPMVFATIVYADIGVGLYLFAAFVFTSRRAVRALATALAVNKTLGLDEADK